MNNIKPIETYYNGYRFRSRLEARIAVFLDALGVEYEYEPEGFELESGKYYLPDFRVKCFGTRGHKTHKPFDLWIEVKGKMTREDADKIREFSGFEVIDWDDYIHGVTGAFERINPILIIHKIPGKGESSDGWALGAGENMDGINIYPFNYELVDGDNFGAYPAADNQGHFYLWGDDSNYINREDVDRVENAWAKARQARFEHGETPTT
jgi:hypothetical protein